MKNDRQKYKVDWYKIKGTSFENVNSVSCSSHFIKHKSNLSSLSTEEYSEFNMQEHSSSSLHITKVNYDVTCRSWDIFTTLQKVNVTD
ncbi:hypothetical protein T4A_2102 [Trichinella pseudospiralis]|uniref:Uncharacterized protein n=1 Tax=Trichinella pseudospiralis TaxID=6337 RepID=A0A0V1E0U1_TRIPS|nr:hypothetical protein T4A_2102 [Trichinella pseudospiralis]KRZ29036.1 hypothetical protein T4C_5431 [Trichinella pseudospiralis]